MPSPRCWLESGCLRSEWYPAGGASGVWSFVSLSVAAHTSWRYLPGERQWIKVKKQRTADCVVIGVAGDRAQPELVLGLRHPDGQLHHSVRFASVICHFQWVQPAASGVPALPLLPPRSGGVVLKTERGSRAWQRQVDYRVQAVC